MLAGDFNTLAPGELLDIRQLPYRLRTLVWLSGGRIRWKTIQAVLAAGYVDGYRWLNPLGAGATFPTWAPHIRLDYVFVQANSANRLRVCSVLTMPDAGLASDYFPLFAEFGSIDRQS